LGVRFVLESVMPTAPTQHMLICLCCNSDNGWDNCSATELKTTYVCQSWACISWQACFGPVLFNTIQLTEKVRINLPLILPDVAGCLTRGWCVPIFLRGRASANFDVAVLTSKHQSTRSTNAEQRCYYLRHQVRYIHYTRSTATKAKLIA
jgi:hypothetical protein